MESFYIYKGNKNNKNIIKLKTVKKKRLLKLLMSKGYSRNEAITIYNKYMKKHKQRTILGMDSFLELNKANTITVEIGDKEVYKGIL